MKDRQPTKVLANGAIRYGIYNADETLNRYEYMKREDAPTVEGTPLNKANLLSDEAVVKIWSNADTRPNDPSVSEALMEVKKGTARIGDIKMTAREIVSNAWLPCDGRSITSTEYPELFSLLRTGASPGDWELKAVTCSDGSTFDPRSICCANNTFFAIHDNYKLYASSDAITWNYIAQIDAGTRFDRASTMSAYCRSGKYYLTFNVYENNSSGAPTYYGIMFVLLNSDLSVAKTTLVATSNSSYNFSLAAIQIFALTDTVVLINTFSWHDSYSTYNQRFVSNNSGDSFTQSSGTLCASVWTSDYDPVLERVYEVYDRVVRYQDKALDTYTAVGSVPDNLISSDALVQGAYICLETNTVVIVYLSGYRLKYVYSIDRGSTWTAGDQLVATSTANYDDTINSVTTLFVNGLLLVPVTTKNSSNISTYWLCSMSDPATGFYTTTDVSGAAALSDAGLAVVGVYDQQNAIYVCDYSISAKQLPTINPDTRSHAYIKAMEE